MIDRKPLPNNRIALFFLIFICYSLLTTPGITSQRSMDNGDKSITDNQTGLMWISKDNGFPINWFDAVKYCEKLKLGGYFDWRMPTLAELRSLFNPNEKNQNGYHLNKLITTTAQSCWSSETYGNSAGRFNFTHGKEYWLRKSYSGPTRVLAVRNLQ